MLWTFHRQGHHFHYEIHRAETGSDFELVLYHPDGEQTRERYSDPAELTRRVMDLQKSLLDDGWFFPSDPRR